MTNKEALKQIRSPILDVATSDSFCEALEVAEDAILKQIPKTPTRKQICKEAMQDSKEDPICVMTELLCPCCEQNVYMLDNFCGFCGQAIDWTEE